MALPGWSDAASGDQTKEGRCRLGYGTRHLSFSQRGPRHLPQRASKFTRNLVKRSLGSEIMDHVALFRGFYGPCVEVSPGMLGLEDCAISFTDLENERMITEEYLVRHFTSIQQASEQGKLGNVFWLPTPGNPADGSTKVKRDLVPLLSLLEPGSLFREPFAHFMGVAFSETPGD